MEKHFEYVDDRPISFLDIVAATADAPEKYYWSRLAYQVTFIVTELCNMRCTYCYDKSRVKKQKERQELASEEIIKIIRNIRSIGIKQIKITGGEPFLKPDIVDILDACQGTALYLCTNGTYLNEYLEILSGLAFEKLHIHSSLDGMDSHTKYAKGGLTAERLLQVLKEAKSVIPGVHVGVNTVINQDNVYEFSDMYRAILAAGLDKWTISMPYIVSEVVRNNHPFPEFELLTKAVAALLKEHFLADQPIHLSIGGFYKQEMFGIKTLPPKEQDEHPCMPNCNGARGLIIDAFGNVLDCLLDNTGEDCALKGFKEGLFVQRTKAVIERPFYSLKIKDVAHCNGCRYVRLCGAGCPYNSKILFGSHANPDPIRCSCYQLMEKYIPPVLPESYQQKLLEYINPKGKEPPYAFKSVAEILSFFNVDKRED